jgi:hypothetical protein
VKGPTTPQRKTSAVWAISRSLAATEEIDFSFFSCGYLDVSVHRVRRLHLWIQCRPVRESRDQHSFNSSPELFAVFHALRSLLTPRHPPCALSSLVHINPTLFSIAILSKENRRRSKAKTFCGIHLLIQHARLHRARLKRVTLDLKCVPFAIPLPSPWWSQALKIENKNNAKSLGEQNFRDQSPLQSRDRGYLG